MKIRFLILIISGLSALCVHSSEKKNTDQPSTSEPMDVELSVTTIDTLPDEVVINEIMPKLDNKALLHWAKSSKKYAEFFKKELAIREYFATISNEDLEKLYKSPETAELELNVLALSPKQLKERAENEIEFRNMRKQRGRNYRPINLY